MFPVIALLFLVFYQPPLSLYDHPQSPALLSIMELEWNPIRYSGTVVQGFYLTFRLVFEQNQINFYNYNIIKRIHGLLDTE